MLKSKLFNINKFQKRSLNQFSRICKFKIKPKKIEKTIRKIQVFFKNQKYHIIGGLLCSMAIKMTKIKKR